MTKEGKKNVMAAKIPQTMAVTEKDGSKVTLKKTRNQEPEADPKVIQRAAHAVSKIRRRWGMPRAGINLLPRAEEKLLGALCSKSSHFGLEPKLALNVSNRMLKITSVQFRRPALRHRN